LDAPHRPTRSRPRNNHAGLNVHRSAGEGPGVKDSAPSPRLSLQKTMRCARPWFRPRSDQKETGTAASAFFAAALPGSKLPPRPAFHPKPRNSDSFYVIDDPVPVTELSGIPPCWHIINTIAACYIYVHEASKASFLFCRNSMTRVKRTAR
jgi:hypothetical protein